MLKLDRIDGMVGEDKQCVPVCFTTDAPADLEPKVRYAFCELLRGCNVRLATPGSGIPRVHYGRQSDGADVFLYRSPRLSTFLTTSPSERPPFTWKELADTDVPLPLADDRGTDILGSAFYWLSGWDEYARGDRDEHGRPTFAGSVQQTLSDRALPFVDPLRMIVVQQLEVSGVTVQRATDRWTFCVTHDIDYVRKWTPGSVVRALWRSIVDRDYRGRLEIRHNPYRDAVIQMLQAVASDDGRSTYFFKAGGGSPRDVEYDLHRGAGRATLDAVIRAGMEIGLHPAYESHLNVQRLKEERGRLRAASGRAVKASRQHYLRTGLPESARALVEAGLSVDATLGFPDAPGFRNGTTYPFRIYDLQRNRPLAITAIPLAFMDASLFNRQHLSVQEAVDAACWTMDEAMRHSGVVNGLWHNVLWDEADYPGWGEHFERCLMEARARQAHFRTVSEAAETYKPASESF